MVDLIKALLGIAAALAAAFYLGGRKVNAKRDAEQAQEADETEERMRNAFNDRDSSPDAARSRLRSRAGR